MEKIYCTCFFGYEKNSEYEFTLCLDDGILNVEFDTNNLVEKLYKIRLGETYVFDTYEKNNKIICRGIHSIKEIID